MTTEELRELDQQVAESRGIRVVERDGVLWEEHLFCLSNGKRNLYLVELPRYSVAPAASRVLLDEMAADPETVEIRVLFERAPGLGSWWEVDDTGERWVATMEDTLDVAICKAFLAWKAVRA